MREENQRLKEKFLGGEKKEKMNKTKIVFGIGIVLAVLAVFTASAAAANTIYLVPSDSSSGVGETTDVTVYLDLDPADNVAGMQFHLKYEDDVVDIVNITSAVEDPATTDWDMWDAYWKVGADGHHYLFVTATKFSGFTGTDLVLAKMTLSGLSPGTRPLDFLTVEDVGIGGDPTELADTDAEKLTFTAVDGTFACLSPPETFSKDLVAGWNLISLPLTNATDMTVANIIDTSLSGKYNALYKYDASAHNFVPLSSTDVMENGVGYFINMTSAGMWTYTGSAYIDMSVGLSTGLNMVGWLNCSKSISSTSLDDSSNVSYIARWNAAEQSYETYNPAAPDPYTPGGFNDFFDMERGTGYFISAKAATTLIEGCA